MTTDNGRYADKIAKLLRKAESTSSQAEAEALVEKAQALMTTYAVDEAMLASARGENNKEREKVVEQRWAYTGQFSGGAKPRIGSAIARENGCRVLVSDERKWKKQYLVYVIGFESDVERARMLDVSVQLQAIAALTEWWGARREEWDVKAMTGSQRFRARHDFLFGFVSGLNEALARGREAGTAEAAQHEADRSHVDLDEASESVALTIRDRKDRVNDWVDEHYGQTTRSRARGYYGSSAHDARGAGRAAGRRADVGQPSVAGAAAGALGR